MYFANEFTKSLIGTLQLGRLRKFHFVLMILLILLNNGRISKGPNLKGLNRFSSLPVRTVELFRQLESLCKNLWAPPLGEPTYLKKD